MSNEQNTGANEQKTTDDGRAEKHPVHSSTPENAIGQINPSSPADTGTTPGTVAEVG
jgi:hypothetical protein